MNKIKKVLTISSIVFLIGAVGLLIASIFGFKAFSGINLSFLLTFAILCVGSIVLQNSLSILNHKKYLAIISIVFTTIAVILGLIISWGQFEATSVVGKITLTIGLFTILFNILVSNYIKLSKNYLILQIITYIFIFVVDIILTICILGYDIFKISIVWQIFAVICLVTFILLVVLSILGKKLTKYDSSDKQTKVKSDNNDEYVTIKKSEYEDLKEKISLLESQLNSMNKKSK